jgi:hypothetical protein
MDLARSAALVQFCEERRKKSRQRGELQACSPGGEERGCLEKTE